MVVYGISGILRFSLFVVMLVIHEIINQEVAMGTELFACWRPFTKPPLVMVYRFVYKYSTLIDIINYSFS